MHRVHVGWRFSSSPNIKKQDICWCVKCSVKQAKHKWVDAHGQEWLVEWKHHAGDGMTNAAHKQKEIGLGTRKSEKGLILKINVQIWRHTCLPGSQIWGILPVLQLPEQRTDMLPALWSTPACPWCPARWEASHSLRRPRWRRSPTAGLFARAGARDTLHQHTTCPCLCMVTYILDKSLYFSSLPKLTELSRLLASLCFDIMQGPSKDKMLPLSANASWCWWCHAPGNRCKMLTWDVVSSTYLLFVFAERYFFWLRKRDFTLAPSWCGWVRCKPGFFCLENGLHIKGKIIFHSEILLAESEWRIMILLLLPTYSSFWEVLNTFLKYFPVRTGQIGLEILCIFPNIFVRIFSWDCKWPVCACCTLLITALWLLPTNLNRL